MKRNLVFSALLGLSGVLISGVPRLASHDGAFTDEHLLAADAKDLKTTVVTPYLRYPIDGDANVLWCGSYQLAWNEIAGLIGQNPQFADAPPAVAELNRKDFTRNDLDEACFVALAGFVRDGIFSRIDRELARKFQGRATPRHLPPPRLTPRPQDFVTYSYLFKHLEFAKPFERLAEKLPFDGQKLPCFGMVETKSGHAAMVQQVHICEYGGPDDFVIELKTKAAQDQLILAKTKPAATLAETIDQVLDRMAKADTEAKAVAKLAEKGHAKLDEAGRARLYEARQLEAQAGDVLMVPKLNFDILRRYEELEGLKLITANPNVARDLQILSAVQSVRFQFDEKGVRLKSESHTSFSCSAGAPVPQHFLVFDKPFLVMLKRKDAGRPYFALWVQNAELLVK